MITMQNWEQARSVKKFVRKDVFEGSVTDFIATHLVRQSGVQAFLVEQDPNWVVPPHFHVEHQFQVIVAGGGTIGRHPVAPLTVHYAAPETGYGPITAGPEGISYLTMRVNGDTGAWYLHKPGSRERMTPGLKREQKHGAPATKVDLQALATLAAPVVETLIEPRVDGLAAHLVRLPPGNSAKLPAQYAHAGRYFVVMQGQAYVGAVTTDALSVVFVSPDEDVEMCAGANGAEVLVLQFPVDALGAQFVPERRVEGEAHIQRPHP